MRSMIYQSPLDNSTMKETRGTGFAQKVRSLMLAKGWNQSDLARRVSDQLPDTKDMSRQRIHSYLKGVHLPEQNALFGIAAALGVDPMELVPDFQTKWVGGTKDKRIMEYEDRKSQGPKRNTLTVDITKGTARVVLDVDMPLADAMRIMEIVRKESTLNGAA